MNRKHTKESINKELKETNRQLVLLDEYINPKTDINFKCLVCGYIWNTRYGLSLEYTILPL